jgi:putative ABC transport system permease protein
MTIGRIIWNNARQRPLSTTLTSFSVALGTALIVAIMIIRMVSEERFRVGYSAYDLIVGAKGSPLQLTLNVVYNLDTSPGNVPWTLYDRIRKDPRVRLAVPYSVGDNYKGFRLVGTTDTYLKEFEPMPGQPFELAAGRVFNFSEDRLRDAMQEALERGREDAPTPTSTPQGKKKDVHSSREEHGHHEEHGVFEAVVGSAAAQEAGLKVGDTFVASHGLQESGGEEHAESPWTVVGVLRPTGTPADQAIYINLDSFYHIKGHVIDTRGQAWNSAKKEEAKKPKEPEAGEISAIVLKMTSAIAIWDFRKEINESSVAQAASPAEEIRKLWTIVGNVNRIVMIQAVLIIIVSAVGTGLAMFNSMNERRRDIAVMRALGARRRTIFAIIVGEATLIAGFGVVLGLLLGHGLVYSASPIVEAAMRFTVPAWQFYHFEISVIVGVLLVGAIAGIGPAVSAYRTDVATGLAPKN